jgi:hypothetical protein
MGKLQKQGRAQGMSLFCINSPSEINDVVARRVFSPTKQSSKNLFLLD